MKRKVLVIENGGIAKNQKGNHFCNSSTGIFLNKLQDKGFRVTYGSYPVNINENAVIYDYNLSSAKIETFLIIGHRPKSYLSLVYLFLLILRHKNIYIFYPGGPSKISSKICWLLGKKYGVYVRGNGIYKESKICNGSSIQDFTEIPILKRASFLITVSDTLKARLKAIHPQSDKIYLIKSMLNWDERDIITKSNFEVSKILNILFVGSLIPLKGIDELIEVSSILNKRQLPHSMKIVGGGELLKGLIEKQKKNEISKNVHFLGAIYDKEKLRIEYKEADIFLFPSRNEGFPRVLYEAMIHQLPIFTTFVGGIPGIMKDKFNCIEIPVNDPENQTQVILNCIRNNELMKKIATNGQQTLLKKILRRKPHHQVLIKCFEK